jgi:hypothetical protein
VRLGVRSIEHGNQLDEPSAQAMVKSGAFLSQTLITYVALRQSGQANGMPAALVAKVGKLVEQGSAAIGLAKRRGVRITYGTDLLATMKPKQLEGFGLLLEAGLSPAEALDTATRNGAALLGVDAGEIAVGKLCDLACATGDRTQRRALAATRCAKVPLSFRGRAGCCASTRSTRQACVCQGGGERWPCRLSSLLLSIVGTDERSRAFASRLPQVHSPRRTWSLAGWEANKPSSVERPRASP